MTKDEILRAVVKPLVWVPNPDSSERGTVAVGAGKTYHACDDGWTPHRQMRWTEALSLAAAQAAAEADYRARVAAVLDVDKIAALVEAAERAIGHITGCQEASGARIALRDALAAFQEKPHE